MSVILLSPVKFNKLIKRFPFQYLFDVPIKHEKLIKFHLSQVDKTFIKPLHLYPHNPSHSKNSHRSKSHQENQHYDADKSSVNEANANNMRDVVKKDRNGMCRFTSNFIDCVFSKRVNRFEE